ncbi:MAG: DUF1015 family protein [Bdellovibrionales bacterium]|nr:DUF1015 family protein [Bdellovibrionales bacterium]
MYALLPYQGVVYSRRNRAQFGRLAVSDLDTAENLWGGADASLSFRNVLVGSPEQRSQIWQAWISAGELEMEDHRGFHVLRPEFQGEDGTARTRWALLGSAHVDGGKILTHENVIAEGVERARQATESCEADIAPIFCGCDDEAGAELRRMLPSMVSDAPPLIEFTDGTQAKISFWSIHAPRAVQSLADLFRNRDLFLLDGHHRLAGAKENQRHGLGDGQILACVTSMREEDIAILPIHRVVHCQRWILQDTLQAELVALGCRLRELPGYGPHEVRRALRDLGSARLYCLMVHAHSNRLWQVEFGGGLEAALPLASLPVHHLDEAVLKNVEGSVAIPVPDDRLALEQLALDQAQVGFFLPPARADQVRDVARCGLVMPRKSTRFVPKPPLGLVCRPWSLSG